MWSNRQQLFRSLLEHLSNTCKWSFVLKAIWSTPTCRFNRHQLVDSINTLVSYWSTTTYRQQRPLTLNWPFEKSIAAIVIYKRSICKIHRKQLNTRLENNRTGSLKFVPNWNLVLFASTVNTYFPAISIFCAGLGRRYPSEQPELAGGRSGGSIGMALYYYSFVYCICYYTVITSLLRIITYSYYYIIITHYYNVVM